MGALWRGKQNGQRKDFLNSSLAHLRRRKQRTLVEMEKKTLSLLGGCCSSAWLCGAGGGPRPQ